MFLRLLRLPGGWWALLFLKKNSSNVDLSLPILGLKEVAALSHCGLGLS